MTTRLQAEASILEEVTRAADELVDFTIDLVKMPTVNPPGEGYRECAELIGGKLQAFGHQTAYITADASAEHSDAYPRVNVLGRREGSGGGPTVHFNGHFDVVPAGGGWTVDPFAGVVREGRLYGRGSADMKAGLACALFAVEAVRRAGVELAGSVEISGTVDEESGGFAGLAHLAEQGLVARGKTDHVIIPEPLDVDRVCLGHRGVYWFKVISEGRIGHGAMPFLGVNAIEQMGPVLEEIRRRLKPSLEQRRTAMPVVPDAARQSSININSILGGQAGQEPQTPCVADRCEAVFDRRFVVEESLEATRAEIADLLERVAAQDEARQYSLEELMVVRPTLTEEDDPLVLALARSIESVLGRQPELVASPGTYDHKHVARIAGIDSCVAYGPGALEQAHQPDEWCSIDDMVNATRVMALTLLDLAGETN